MALLAGLHDQVESWVGPSLAGLSTVFHCQVGQLAGLCSHLWLGRVTSSVFWQVSAIGWTLHLGEATGRALNGYRA